MEVRFYQPDRTCFQSGLMCPPPDIQFRGGTTLLKPGPLVRSVPTSTHRQCLVITESLIKIACLNWDLSNGLNPDGGGDSSNSTCNKK